MKVCKICKINKELIYFGVERNSKDGLRSSCKECRKIESKKRYAENREYFIQYNELTKESRNISKKKWGELNKDKVINSNKKWNKNNPSYKTNYDKKRKKIDPEYKLWKNLRCRLSNFLKLENINKNNSTYELIGITPKRLKIYLESKFIEGMSWDNYVYTDGILTI